MGEEKCVDGEELDEKYLAISDQISQIDQKILKTTNREELLSLIEQRKPLSAQLEDIFKQIKKEEQSEIETLTHLAWKNGGILMKGKEIKMHKNGVKISVSKAYIDDAILDANKKYTVILLPE